MKLEINGIDFHYDSVKALEEITFEVNEGEVLGIIGPNGSGKSTLLRCINRVLEPKIGSVLIDGENISGLDRREIARNIGVVPQSSTIHFPFTVFDIVLMGRTPHLGRLDRETSKDLEIAKNAMTITNTLHLTDRPIDEVSGGERQRVIIARALAQEPKILLLDEPTLHLDINHQLEIIELIKRLARKNRLIAVLVSHDLNLANRYSDRLILLRSGRIFSIGKPEDVVTKENIREVYNIEVDIDHNKKTNSLNVVPISSMDNKL
ncbi:MAG: ABC transporter ATP-binding protein [Thermoplasmata archaeon]|nr:ABC transporter ATP-binding protein [Thermoplasmata archaeon]